MNKKERGKKCGEKKGEINNNNFIPLGPEM